MASRQVKESTETPDSDEISTSVVNTGSPGQQDQVASERPNSLATSQSGIETRSSSGHVTDTTKSGGATGTGISPNAEAMVSHGQVGETSSTPSTSQAAVPFGIETGARPKERPLGVWGLKKRSGKYKRQVDEESDSDSEPTRRPRTLQRFHLYGSWSSSGSSGDNDSRPGPQSRGFNDEEMDVEDDYPQMRIRQEQLENERRMANAASTLYGLTEELKEKLVLRPAAAQLREFLKLEELRRQVSALQEQNAFLRGLISKRDEIIRANGLLRSGEGVGPINRNLCEPRDTLLGPGQGQQMMPPQDSSQKEAYETRLRNLLTIASNEACEYKDKLVQADLENAVLKRRLLHLAKLLLRYKKQARKQDGKGSAEESPNEP